LEKTDQQLEEIVLSLIKTWWENAPNVKITIRNNEPRQMPVQKLFQALYTTLQNHIEKIPALENKTQEILSEVQTIKCQQVRPLIIHQMLDSYLSGHEERISALEGKKTFSGEEVAMLIRKETEFLAGEISMLRKEIEQLKRQPVIEQTIKFDKTSSISTINNRQDVPVPSPDPIVEEFNMWAKNPSFRLPAKFYYAEGDIKLRENCVIEEVSSSSGATWIVNRNGPLKYLFPNPNAIDQLGGKIDFLYKINGNRRAKGQNRVNIQKACSIVDGSSGWVEYKGELTLI
jgi:hypothetical protein